VSAAAALSRWRWHPVQGRERDSAAFLPRAATLVGWCGMRGIVTLAAALALPAHGRDGLAFPYRDLVLFVAFSVTLGTLVIQGMTLRPLMNLLRLEDDGSVDREVRLARIEIFRAALNATVDLRAEEIAGLLHRRYEVMLRRAESGLGIDGDVPRDKQVASMEHAPTADAAVVHAALSAERHRLVALRADGTIGDTAFQRLEEVLDLEELHLQQLV
jgi:monovalent cation/hydrogen antiporter